MTEKDMTTEDSAFRNVLVGAWVETKMERDKSLLTVASAGVGLLVAMSATVSQLSVAATLISFGAFLITIICSIMIFSRNAKHLEVLIANDQSQDSDVFLSILDWISQISFAIGIVSLSYLGITNAL